MIFLCASCSSIKNPSSKGNRIALYPESFFDGFHVYSARVNGKKIFPGTIISLSREESKNIVADFSIGSGFSDRVFIREDLACSEKIVTPSHIIGLDFPPTHPYTSGLLDYTLLWPGSILNDGKRWFCACKTIKLRHELNLCGDADEYADWTKASAIYSIKIWYYLPNIIDEQTATLEIPVKFELKDTEPKNSQDSVSSP